MATQPTVKTDSETLAKLTIDQLVTLERQIQRDLDKPGISLFLSRVLLNHRGRVRAELEQRPIETDTDEEEETTTCDFCDGELDQAAHDAGDGLCQTCIDTTIVCEECCDRIAKTDAHATHATLCQGCGESKDEELATEILDAVKEQLQELVDQLVSTDDIDAITAAVAALKALTK